MAVLFSSNQFKAPVQPVKKSITSFGSMSLDSMLKQQVSAANQKVAAPKIPVPSSTPKSASFDPYKASSGTPLPTFPSALKSAATNILSMGYDKQGANMNGTKVVTTPQTFDTSSVQAQILPQAQNTPVPSNEGGISSQFVGGTANMGNSTLGTGTPTQPLRMSSTELPQLPQEPAPSGFRESGVSLDPAISSFGAMGGGSGASSSGSFGGGLGGSNTALSSIGFSGTSSAPGDDEYEKLKKKLLGTYQESDEERSAREELERLDSGYELGKAEIGNKPIAMQFITGQQRALEDRNAALAKPLSYKMMAEQAKRANSNKELTTVLDFEDKKRESAREDRKLAFDMSQPKYGSGVIGEYQFAKQNGYAGSFEQYQNEDANRKAAALGLSPAQLNSTINQIAGSFDNEPIVKSYNTAMEGYEFAKSINPNSGNPADDIGLIYAFAKIMDPNSVVREGEYNTIQKYAQSWAQSFGFNAQRIFSNTNFLSADAKTKLLATLTAKIAPIQQQYENLYNQYQGRIANVQDGGYNTLTDYSTPYKAPSNLGGSQAPAPAKVTDENIRETIRATQNNYQTREQLIEAMVAAGAPRDRASLITYEMIPDKVAAPKSGPSISVFGKKFNL